MKTCNIVVYNVGYGGNIIRFLLSLHPNTFLLAPKGEVDITKPRHEIYSFKNLQWKYGTWANYEKSADWGKIPTSDWMSSFLKQDKYDTLTVADHPDEITPITTAIKITAAEAQIGGIFELHQLLTKFDNINYLTVGISKKYDDQIYSFLRSNDTSLENYFPIKGNWRHQTLITLLQEYVTRFNPYSINFDPFFEGEESFLDEYKKLLTHLKYEINDDILEQALILYRGWISARKATMR